MEIDPYARRHVRFSWWSLLLFAALGLALELLHGVKAGFFLGGATVFGGDPSPAVFITPLGGLALLGMLYLAARGAAPDR